jgi:hypothetical protein
VRDLPKQPSFHHADQPLGVLLHLSQSRPTTFAIAAVNSSIGAKIWQLHKMVLADELTNSEPLWGSRTTISRSSPFGTLAGLKASTFARLPRSYPTQGWDRHHG